jgi:antitoxin CcdA
MPDETRCAAPSAPRKRTKVTLPEALLREARELGVGLSQACERGRRDTETRAAKWLRENRGAIEVWNE